jgi:hypothetical protein
VRGIVLADDPLDLPAPSTARSDLRELTFESGEVRPGATLIPTGSSR